MRPIHEYVEQLDETCWLIGGRFVLKQGTSLTGCLASWKDGQGVYYNIFYSAPGLPDLTALSLSSDVQKVYEAGGSSAVWAIGDEAFCKVKRLVPNATSENTTLKFLHQKQLSFEVPDVLFYAEDHECSFLFVRRLQGRTLTEAWPTLNKHWREHYASCIVQICKDLILWESTEMTGVDGDHLTEWYLANGAPRSFSPENLQENCKVVGMDCSSFKFYHCDLGPGNIIVESEPTKGSIGIIDWETAGFVPIEWVRTKFRLSSGMDLPDHNTEWRALVQQKLGDNGFPDVAGNWMKWFKSK